MKRLLKLYEAKDYLGVSEPEFNKTVRPYIPEIRQGKMIRFDILDLDAWIEHLKEANGRPGKERVQWQKEHQDLERKETCGTSRKSSPVSSFEKALERLNSNKPNDI